MDGLKEDSLPSTISSSSSFQRTLERGALRLFESEEMERSYSKFLSQRYSREVSKDEELERIKADMQKLADAKQSTIFPTTSVCHEPSQVLNQNLKRPAINRAADYKNKQPKINPLNDKLQNQRFIKLDANNTITVTITNAKPNSKKTKTASFNKTKAIKNLKPFQFPNELDPKRTTALPRLESECNSPGDLIPTNPDNSASQTMDSEVLSQGSIYNDENTERMYIKYMNKYCRPPTPLPAVLSKKGQMAWLRQKRNVGVWAQCNSCKKFRYLKDTVDPLELPVKWYCKWNPDVTRNRCSDAEDKPSPAEQMEIIFNKFNAGSLVYAKIDRKPWWPAIVTDNPQTLTYFKLESFSEEPSHYHVTLFGLSKKRNAWVRVQKLKPYKVNCNNKKINDLKDKQWYKRKIALAKKQANKALTMTLIQRLEKYNPKQ